MEFQSVRVKYKGDLEEFFNVHQIRAYAINIWEDIYDAVIQQGFYGHFINLTRYSRIDPPTEYVRPKVGLAPFTTRMIAEAYAHHIDQHGHALNDWLRAHIELLGTAGTASPENIEIDELSRVRSFISEQKIEDPAVPAYARGNLCPHRVGAIRDIDIDGVPARVYFSTAVAHQKLTSFPVVLWCHGGGSVSGDEKNEHAVITRIATAIEGVVISLRYGLAPQHDLLQICTEVEKGLVWCQNPTNLLGIDTSRIIVAGNSFGALVSLIVGIYSDCPQPRGIVANVPIINSFAKANDALRLRNSNSLGLTIEEMLRCQEQYLPDNCHPQYGNLNERVLDELSPEDLPEIHVFVAASDILMEEGALFGRGLSQLDNRHQLHVLDKACHIWLDLAGEIPTYRAHVSALIDVIVKMCLPLRSAV